LRTDACNFHSVFSFSSFPGRFRAPGSELAG
jgi:hypothetical protein